MNPLRTVRGVAAPLLVDNIDTDVITPMQRIIRVRAEALGDWAFEPLRFLPPRPDEDGDDLAARVENPDFPLNRPAWRRPPILLAGANFGCGSSRETAVWALAGIGVRVVVAPGFGDIFAANCFQNGLLPIVLPAAQVAALAALASRPPEAGQVFTIDLVETRIVDPDGGVHPFAVDPWRRAALLEGRDEIAQTLTASAAIAA